MTLTTLVSSAELTERLGRDTLVIVDCRFMLDDVEWGAREYATRHIPGAVYAHLDRDLSGAKTGVNGRHPLPPTDELIETFSRLGIAGNVQVVAYDQNNGMYASRLWWMLRWMGHTGVAVLDGGFAKWIAEERPTSSGAERNTRAQFAGSPGADAMVDADTVATLTSNAEWRLIDARAPERFRGDVEPIDKVAGHIPGAVDHFFQQNLTAEGTYRSPAELRVALAAIIGEVRSDHVVCYCGSGVTACHNMLALEHAGIHGAKLYPGSWSEWSSDPLRPVSQGA